MSLTFDLASSDHKRLGSLAKRHSARSVSSLVRIAIERYDYGRYQTGSRDHRQLSVRLPEKLRSDLVQASKRKKVSVGELVRAAVTDFLEDPDLDLPAA
ncbi:MAG: CopG family transcriptional regulator [Opitutales bacterium]|nr:CopG family transcriptional regulator [Opitutales bacterium]